MGMFNVFLVPFILMVGMNPFLKSIDFRTFDKTR